MKSILMITSTWSTRCDDGYASIDVVKTSVITGGGSVKVCKVVGRCDRLCSDEC